MDNGFYEVETCANVFSAAVSVEHCCSLSVGSPRSAIAALLNGISCQNYQRHAGLLANRMGRWIQNNIFKLYVLESISIFALSVDVPAIIKLSRSIRSFLCEMGKTVEILGSETPFYWPSSLILWGSVKHFSSLLSFYSPPHCYGGKRFENSEELKLMSFFSSGDQVFSNSLECFVIILIWRYKRESSRSSEQYWMTFLGTNMKWQCWKQGGFLFESSFL